MIHSIRSEVALHLQMSSPPVANSEHTLCSDWHQAQLLRSLKGPFCIKAAETNGASDVADCVLSAQWLNRRFSFHCLLGYLTLLRSRNTQMKKPNCYYNLVDVRHLHTTLRHLALFETYRIQCCNSNFSKYAT